VLGAAPAAAPPMASPPAAADARGVASAREDAAKTAESVSLGGVFLFTKSELEARLRDFYTVHAPHKLLE
jgi:hypothetical protein